MSILLDDNSVGPYETRVTPPGNWTENCDRAKDRRKEEAQNQEQEASQD